MARTRIDSWLVLTICDCFSADKLAFLKNTCAFIKGFTCPATASEPSQQNVESRVVIPHFLAWLTLEVVDEVVYNPSSSKYLSRLKVCPQVIKQILNTFWCFPVLDSFTQIECTFFESLPKFTSPSLWVGSLVYWTQKEDPASRTV